MKKPTRGRQKRTIQSDDAPRQTAWTHEEEITLCKGWVEVPENSMLGNTRKDVGFCCAVLQYMESKIKQYGRQTLKESGASDAYYYARVIMDYEAETGTTFKLRHCWEILKDSPKWMQKSGEASINLNANVGDNDEDEVQEIRRPKGRDKEKDVAKKKGSRASRRQIKMREVECREREMRNQEYRQCQDDIRFYLEPYDHLTGDAQLAMEELRAEIKAKYDLPY
ncbi:hypothetical protein Tco_0965558 [Tanacetum coccineum]